MPWRAHRRGEKRPMPSRCLTECEHQRRDWQVLQLPHDRAIVSQLDAQSDSFAVPLGAFRLKLDHIATSFRSSCSAGGDSPFGSNFFFNRADGDSPFGSNFLFNFAFVRRSEFHGRLNVSFLSLDRLPTVPKENRLPFWVIWLSSSCTVKRSSSKKWIISQGHPRSGGSGRSWFDADWP